MAELVLFYVHALLNVCEPYPPVPPTPAYFVTLPSFPRFVVREGLFCQGPLVHRGKLSLPTPMSKGIPWLLSVKFKGHRGTAYDEIVVTFGRLCFWLFQTYAVAKAALSLEASERLQREYDIYQSLLSLQGIAIPLVYGLYRNRTDESLVLILSHAGTALTDFRSLSLKDR